MHRGNLHNTHSKHIEKRHYAISNTPRHWNLPKNLLITAHCCCDVSKCVLMRTCGVPQAVLKLFKPYLVYDPKPKVMHMGHIRPTGKPFTRLPRDPSTANHTRVAQLQFTACCFHGNQEACERGRAARVRARGRDRAVSSTLQYCTCLNLALASFSFIRPCATR